MVLSSLLAVWLLLRHRRSQCDATERLRTALMLAIAVVGVLLAVVPYNFPSEALLVSCLMLLALLLLTTVTFGLGVLETELKGLATVYVAALLAIAAGGYAVAARLVASSAWLLVLGLALGAVLVLLLGQVARALMEQHARTTQLATLGRWSADMAHELKNPLAALKGAAQYLLTEADRGGTLAEQREMISLLVSEADRMDALIARYQRYGETPALRSPQSLNALASECVERVSSAGRGRAALHTELASSLPDCLLDLPLASAAIENAITNALEATGEHGSVVVRTYCPDAPTGGVAVLSVQDTGRGMTPRELAMAFVEPFSTKGPGRGRGLSLIKRSMESLGGEARVDSQLGRGTCVQLRFQVA
jgi:two-component system, NtrC family, sensor histidine kinase HydH